jgi:CheY-like chemotaxis protein
MVKKMRVLLVDDEKEFLDSIADRFEIKGFEVQKASSGPAAIELARKHHFDAAVVDLKMPEMDGLVTITKLKEQQPELKTILLTGFGNEKIKQTTEALNSSYFEKGDLDSFWSFIKRLPKKLEDNMAAAGMATHGGLDEAQKISRDENGD